MTIKLEITDPQNHGVLELRAIAHFFNCLAADRENAAKGLVRATGEQSIQEMLDSGAIELIAADTEASTTAEDHHVVLHADGAQAFAPAAADDPAAVFGGEAPKPADAVAPTPPAPVAPVAPTAPASTAPAPTTPSSEIVTDKAGLPWDRRIHSESKSINKTDGLWRTKRGVDPALVAQVEAEHRALPPVAASAPVAPVAPTPPAPIAPTTEQSPGVPKNLGELMIVAQQLVASGKIASLDVVRATAAELGVVALPLLGTRPDMVEAVYNKLIGA